jgi:hypothetical protein
MSEIYYLVRSRMNGQYLVAHPRQESGDRASQNSGFLLLFKEQFDALSYLNTHGKDVADQFAVESLPQSQLEGVLKRWGFVGFGIVQDPLLPKVEFLGHTPRF